MVAAEFSRRRTGTNHPQYPESVIWRHLRTRGGWRKEVVMPETGMVALARMLRERAEQLGFHLSSRKSFEAANALVMTGAADPSNLSYMDTTGEEAVHNVLSFYLARTGSLSGRAS